MSNTKYLDLLYCDLLLFPVLYCRMMDIFGFLTIVTVTFPYFLTFYRQLIKKTISISLTIIVSRSLIYTAEFIYCDSHTGGLWVEIKSKGVMALTLL